MFKNILILIGLFTMVSCDSLSQKQILPQSVSYTGRVHMTEKEAVFSYPGTEIRFKTNSESIGILLSDFHNANDDRNQYSVYINGLLKRRIRIVDGRDLYRISGLDTDRMNSVRIVKRTEGKVGFAKFQGLMIDTDADIGIDPYENALKILFIGNSITCGYGLHASKAEEDFTAETENVEESFAGIISRRLGAESHFIAFSGKGVFRNWGQVPPYINTMGDLYTRTLSEDANGSWNPLRFVPDRIVISLGTNDFSPPNGADSLQFCAKYKELLRLLDQQYRQVPVFMLQSSMLQSDNRAKLEQYLTVIEAEMQAAGKIVYFIDVSAQTGKLGYGADWHPSAAQARYNANEIFERLKQKGFLHAKD